MFTALHNFCAVDLSAFYFDMRKDSLYCDRRNNTISRGARTVLDELFSCLTAWLAPIICFTAEEAWLARYPAEEGSVHLRQFPEIPATWRDDALAAKWEKIRELRRVVTGALEVERAAKRIGSSLQASPVIFASAEYLAAIRDIDLAELCITSGARIGDGDNPVDGFSLDDVVGVTVLPGQAEGQKCERCWKILPDVGSVAAHDDLCPRCSDAVDNFVAAAD
jgi:isoleucyl-tRNA synthetase